MLFSSQVGQVVKARVVNVNARRSKMSLSLRTNPSAADITAESAENKAASAFANKPKPSSAAMDVAIGSLVSGIVVTATANDVFIRLDGPDGPTKGGHSHDDVRGRIPIAHLSDHGDNVKGLLATFTPGSRVIDAVVLDIPKSRGSKGNNNKERAGAVLPLVLSRKPALVIAAKHNLLPSRIEQVSVGQELTGFVGNVTSFGVFVRFLSGLSALAPRANTSDLIGADPSDLYTVGQTVRVKVTDVNVGKKRFVVTLKPSVVNGLDSFFLNGFWSERRYAFQHDVAVSKKANKKAVAKGDGDAAAQDDVSDKVALKRLKIGQACEAVVLQVKDYGLILELEGGAVGFCMKEHAPKDSPATGAKLTCRVLDIDYEKGVVDVTMRQRLVRAARERLPTIDSTVAASITETEGGKAAPAQQCTVELIKSHYAVVSLPGHKHAFALAPISTFNGRPKGLDGLAVGVRCQCHLLCAPEADPTNLAKHGRLPLPVVRLVSDAQLGARRPRALSNVEGETKSSSDKPTEERVRVETGATLRAKVRNIKGEWVFLTLANTKRSKGVVMKARVHISNMREPPAQDSMLAGKKKTRSVLSRVNVGNMIKRCRVVNVHKESAEPTKVAAPEAEDSDSETEEKSAPSHAKKSLMVEVTLRPSHFKLDVDELAKVGKDDSIKVGDVRVGWVSAITDEGLWVAFSSSSSGLVYCANVSSELERVQEILCGGDDATASVKQRLNNYFDVGQPVYAKVLVTGSKAEGETEGQAMSLVLVDK
jgi:ribosomal protein S1